MITNSHLITHRMMSAIGFALVWSGGAEAARKPKPPAISVYQDGICLMDLRWVRDESSSIQGIVVNNSGETLTSLSLRFAMKAGPNLVGTASDSFAGEIPRGGQWRFTAYVLRPADRYVLDRTETGTLHYAYRSGGRERYTTTSIEFEPVFDPLARCEIQQWEKVHGKRQR